MALGHLPSSRGSASALPLAMLAAPKIATLGPSDLTDALRRMGLQPSDPPADQMLAECKPDVWCQRIVLGQLQAIIRRSSPADLNRVRAGATNVLFDNRIPENLAPDTILIVHPIEEEDEIPRAAQSRLLFQMLCLIVDIVDADQLFWSPAQLWSPASEFRSAVDEMLTSGMPPVLHIIAFPTDNEGRLSTRGLAYFCGQELSLTDAGGHDPAGQLRRLARLAIDMMTNGPITAARQFPGMVAGEAIVISELAERDGAKLLGVEIVPQ